MQNSNNSSYIYFHYTHCPDIKNIIISFHFTKLSSHDYMTIARNLNMCRKRIKLQNIYKVDINYFLAWSCNCWALFVWCSANRNPIRCVAFKYFSAHNVTHLTSFSSKVLLWKFCDTSNHVIEAKKYLRIHELTPPHPTITHLSKQLSTKLLYILKIRP